MKKADKNLLNKRSRTSDVWELSLYVLDGNPASVRALNSVTDICEEYLAGRCALEVIDLAIHPEFAKRDQIVAIPTLIKKLPPPRGTMIGDLSNTDRVMTGLGLRPVER
ncbi:MAG TPA: circadian clock KaiB family protein [Desulfomonilaceae bacterium]|nr:circadian clock KaiB family protein [Desulfomonilaceae bacterium]